MELTAHRTSCSSCLAASLSLATALLYGRETSFAVELNYFPLKVTFYYFFGGGARPFPYPDYPVLFKMKFTTTCAVVMSTILYRWRGVLVSGVRR